MGRLKQLRINTSGALVLMQDVEIIYGCFALPPLAPPKPPPQQQQQQPGGAVVDGMDESGSSKVNAPEVKRAFDALKEVVGLFIVPPEHLKGLMEHGYLANQDRDELLLFVANRADFRVHGFLAPWVKGVFGNAVRDGATSPVPEAGGADSPYSGSRAGSPVPAGGQQGGSSGRR